jgi:carbonic anhydrase
MAVGYLLEKNRAWATERTRTDPDYFRRQARAHCPSCLFIGCSDARVPANVVTGTEVGELFVHRNIANQVVATDNNLLAVVQYAVEVLGVEDIVICGHEGCGGVRAALGPEVPAHVEHWLAHLRTIARLHDRELAKLDEIEERARRLVTLNVREQVYNLSRLPVVRAKWSAGGQLRLHGWVYELTDGLLRDLGVTLDGTAAEQAATPSARGLRHSRPLVGAS